MFVVLACLLIIEYDAHASGHDWYEWHGPCGFRDTTERGGTCDSAVNVRFVAFATSVDNVDFVVRDAVDVVVVDVIPTMIPFGNS